MRVFKRWLAYWRENFNLAKDLHERIIFLALLCVLFLSICLRPSIDSRTFGIALESITAFSGISCFLFAVLWLPFKRHEREGNDLKKELTEVKAKIETKEMEAARKKAIGDELGAFKQGLANRIAEIKQMKAGNYASECPAKDSTTIFDNFTDMLLEVITLSLKKHYTATESALFHSTSGFKPLTRPMTSTPEFDRWQMVIDRLKHYEIQLESILKSH
jgi:hypothetical protein